MKLFMIAQGHPLWEDSRVPHSRLARDQDRSSFGLDVLARKDLPLQQYGERIEKFSQDK